MKIVCDSCSTKYSISDDKVRGKVFKIRCKKCSHIIVVRGTADSAPAAVEAPPAAVWHVVVDGDQVGPLTEADVRARASRGEITPDNYVWKEGFADWLKLSEVPDFADLSGAVRAGGEESFPENADATAEPSDRVAYGGEAAAPFGGAEPYAAASSGRVQSSGRVRAPAAAAAPAEDDAFSAPAAPAASPGADLFGMAPVAAHADSGRVRGRGANGAGGARHDGGRVENLTAQRSENSVLFSLSNLQSLAAPPSSSSSAPSSSSTTEGSGLIDIRAMAASTLRSPSSSDGPLSFGSSARSAEDDLPNFGAFSSASPVLMAIPQSSGPPKWVYALFVLAALLIIGVGAVAFSILRKPVMVEQVAAPAPVAPAAKAEGQEGKQERRTGKAGKSADGDKNGDKTGEKIAESDLPPRESGDSSGEKSEKSASERGSSKGKKGRESKGKKGGSGDEKSSSGSGSSAPSGGAAAVAAAEPEKPKAQKGSLDDLLEGALNGRNNKKTKGSDDDSGPKKGGGESAGGGGPLAKGAVVAGMNGIKGKISACYAQFHVPGLAMVNVVIGKSGKVSSATVTGKFAGTPTGTCVETAVKSASFPASDGLSTPYPFTLR